MIFQPQLFGVAMYEVWTMKFPYSDIPTFLVIVVDFAVLDGILYEYTTLSYLYTIQYAYEYNTRFTIHLFIIDYTCSHPFNRDSVPRHHLIYRQRCIEIGNTVQNTIRFWLKRTKNIP